MSICPGCDQQLPTAASCTLTVLHRGGVPHPLRPFGSDRAHGAEEASAARARCGDCGVAAGGHHHLGCDLARCPRCRGQLLGCDCPFDEFGAVVDGVSDSGAQPDEGIAFERGPDGVDGPERTPAPGLAAENPCPRCGSRSVVPILYGRPNPATTALSARGLVELADIVFGDGRPSSRCRACGNAWHLQRA